jgi:type IV pilus assembly protein PilM
MSFFDKIQNTLHNTIQKGGVIHKKHGSVCGIDIGSSSIKVVQLHNNEGITTLDTYGEIALGPLGGAEVGQSTNLSVEKIAHALTDVLTASEVHAERAGVCMPFSASLVKLITLPALSDKKLQTVIPIEARKYIPVPIDQVQLDYFIVPEVEQRLFEKSSGNNLEENTPLKRRIVLIVAMHDDALTRHNSILKKTSLTPLFYELEVFSSVRSTVSRSLAPVVVFDIGASSSKLYLVELGIVLASHVVPMGGQNITRSIAKSLSVSLGRAEELKRSIGLLKESEDPENAQIAHICELTMEHIFAEARRVLIGFERRYNKVVTKGILVGGGAALKGVDFFGQERFDMEVSVGNPFAHIEVPAFLQNTTQEVGPVFAGAIGTALRALKGE